jgi:dihydropyrimidinase
MMLFDRISPAKLGEIPEAIQAGYASIKMFTTDITPQRMAHMVPFGDIWEVIKAVAKAGGLTCIHAEDNDLVMHMYEKLLREDRMGFENLAAAHTTLSEDLAFNRVIRLAESVEGAAMYMVHTSARTGVNAMAAARARGFPVYGETLHQYLLYNSEDYKRPGGQIYHTYPSLKFPDDQAALWQAMRHGAIQCVATDEVCCPLEVKLKGSRIDDTMGGNSGVEPRVSLMYTQMVQQRGFSLEEFVALVSSNAAKIMGLYPRKGALAVGSDADIVLLDPKRAGTIRKENLHETDYTPWQDWDAAVWPSMTVQRGKVMVENGKLLAELTDGQFLPRKIDDAIRSRPAL